MSEPTSSSHDVTDDMDRRMRRMDRMHERRARRMARHMKARRHRHPGVISSQLIFGLILVSLGLLFTLDNLGAVSAGGFIRRFWPLVFIFIGISRLTSTSKTAGLIWILIGSILIGNRLGWFRIDVGDLFPLLFVVLGGYLAWQAITRGGRTAAAASPGEVSNTVSGVAILGGFERKISAGEFRGGELTSFMGGCVVDLRDAGLADDGAVLTVFALMGGVELKLPESWPVTVEVIPILGGVEDRTRPQVAAARTVDATDTETDASATEGGTPAQAGVPGRKRLLVRGFVVMGGVEIHN